MKFQNPSIHHSKVNTHTDRQAESNMPFQLFQSWGHNYEIRDQVYLCFKYQDIRQNNAILQITSLEFCLSFCKTQRREK